LGGKERISYGTKEVTMKKKIRKKKKSRAEHSYFEKMILAKEREGNEKSSPSDELWTGK